MNVEFSEKLLYVVDDNRAMNLFLKDHLEMYFTVKSVYNAKELIELLNHDERLPDAILLDVYLPDMDGYEICQEIKKNEELELIPVLFMSGENSVSMKVKGFQIGAADYITKPFHIEEVIARLKSHIYSKVLQEEIITRNHDLEVMSEELAETKDRMEEQAGELVYMLAEVDEAKALIEQQKDQILNDLQKASIFQKSLLPSLSKDIHRIDWECLYVPSVSLSGDYYDYHRFDEHRFCLLLVDVMGHGTESALVGTMTKMAFNQAVNDFQSPSKILTYMNRNLYAVLEKAEIFATAICAYVDTNKKEIVFSRAAHYLPLPFSWELDMEQLSKTNGFAIGLVEDSEYYDDRFSLKDYPDLIFYTDGIIESMNEDKEMWGKERFYDFFQKNKKKSSKEILSILLDEVKSFTGQEAFEDDISIISLKFIDF